MEIILENVWKRYQLEWIFRNLDLKLTRESRYAILGPNGSGKSTLLRVLSGHLTPTRGKVSFRQDNQRISIENIYTQISIAAPYVEIIEEFSLEEAVRFHHYFKPFREGIQLGEFLEILALPKAKSRPIRYFSSGMKQRLKLLLAILSDTSILLLDEPTSNLDSQGVNWYHELIDRYTDNRLLVVASNTEWEYNFCEERIDLMKFK